MKFDNHMQDGSNLYTLTKQAEIGGAEYSGKSLYERAIGKFYTPEFIIDRLIEEIDPSIFVRPKQVLKVIDPFCGDARMLTKFVNRYSSELAKLECQFYLWDVDREAISQAKQELLGLINSLGINARVHAVCANSFSHFSVSDKEAYDICITNPPWEVVKPDKREMACLSQSQAREYVEQLKATDDFLTQKFPISQPSLKFAGWGTNLARVGVELALKLVGEDGTAAVVSPATLFADKLSVDLRKWMLNGFSIERVEYYQAETKLFGKVDQEILYFIAKNQTTNHVKPSFSYVGANLMPQDYGRLEFDKTTLETRNFCLPNYFGIKAHRLLESLAPFPRLDSLHDIGLWTGRELDETRHKRYLCETGKIPFYKGRMIGRYSIVEEPELYVDDHYVPNLPKTHTSERIVWRDVSRGSQKRRMIATIIESNSVTGNSLNVAYAQNTVLLRALLLVMNSLIFELQVRSYLSTSHVSLGTVRMARIPDLTDKEVVNELAFYGQKLLDGATELEEEAESAVCRAYKVSTEVSVELRKLFYRDDS